jgi:cell division protein FtsQ
VVGEGGRRESGVAVENRRRIDPVVLAEARRARRARALVAAWIALSVALLGGASVAGWRYLTRGEALRVRELRFTGSTRSTADELAALSPVKPGDNLLGADLGALEKALLRHPWVRRVEARRALPPAIDVTVEERSAAALVELGGLYLVDREAQVFKRAAPGDGLDLPLVTGLSRESYLARKDDFEPLLAGAIALVEGYAAAGLAAARPIAEVHVDLQHGITLYVGEEGTQVRLGSGDLPQKLARLEKTLAALGADGRRAEVVHLDNRNHPTWVTVRMAGGVGEPGGVSPPGSKAGGTGPRGP